MEERNIVTIDLGTSKIALTVAKVNGEDIQVIYYKERPADGIRYSGVFNSTKAAASLKALIQDAEEALEIKITQAFVGMSKYPVRVMKDSGIITGRGEDTDITEENVSALKRAVEMAYPLEDETKEAVYGAVAQAFSDGENFQILEDDIIGMTSDILEGHFKIFIGSRKALKDIDTVMKKAGISAKKKFFTADTTANAVLYNEEKENGVALVDFGGGCTTVTVYHGNIMRHYASIPFGGNSITNDIRTEAQISEQLAENIKLAYGACIPEKLYSLSDKELHIVSNNTEPDKRMKVKYLSEVITARVEEIITAVLYEIYESGFADKLKSGVVVTGGVAQTANLCNFINELSGYKVRTGYPLGRVSISGCNDAGYTSAATSIGLLLAAKADEEANCAVDGQKAVAGEGVIEDAEEKVADIEVVAGVEEVAAEEVADGAAEVKAEEMTEELPEEGNLFSEKEMGPKVDPAPKPTKGLKVFFREAQKTIGEKLEQAELFLDSIYKEQV